MHARLRVRVFNTTDTFAPDRTLVVSCACACAERMIFTSQACREQ
jgi:hypothetical protein